MMAIAYFTEQGIHVEFDLQLVFPPHFCSVMCVLTCRGLNQEDLAMMDNAVIQSQGNLLCGMDYFQWQWSHVCTTLSF